MADQLHQTAIATTSPDGEDVVEGEGRSRAGIDVQKVLHRGQFEVPSLVYRIQSSREEAVTVRLVDRIPEGLPMEAVGFHEAYGKQYWSVLGTEAIEFVRRVEPGESVITVCGIQISDATGVSVLLEPPELEVSADRGGESDGDEPSGDDQASGSTETAGDDSRRGVDADEETETDDGWGDVTLDLEDTTENDASGASSSDASEGPDRNVGELPTDGVAGSLLEELRAGELTETEKRRLREELNLRVGETASSYVDHLHNRVEEERARLESRLDSLETNVDELYGLKADAGELEALGESATALERTVTKLEEQSATLDQVTTVRDSLEELDDRTPNQSVIDELDRTTADVETVSELRETVETLEGEKADRQAVETLRSDVAELERLAAQAADLDALAERVDDLESVVAREADLEALSAEVDDLNDRAASEERVDSITRALEAEYVTEDDVAETIDEGLDDRLRAVAPFGAGVCLASLGVGLAASAPFWGIVAVLLGGGLAGRWWRRRR